MLKFLKPVQLPTSVGKFMLYGFEQEEHICHLALVCGDISSGEDVLFRLHSSCLTGDALFSSKCDCGEQLLLAMQKVQEAGRGVIFYLQQEGRGIGLANKLRAYALQDEGMDTMQANVALGLPKDARDYSVLQPMFEEMGIKSVRIMSNNAAKIRDVQDIGGVKVLGSVEHICGVNKHNKDYLRIKGLDV